ncbi:hypothetical protein JMJ35_004505 [Cladonia borealis]|uniref:Rhodopsin domain-containing protein n=1 Tax=Cladonia borealis TaxID=184061 RepID=A0AA39R474_9LECA|nr:hypothetical protein JMJ35_004505 [Cladonia borealis]
MANPPANANLIPAIPAPPGHHSQLINPPSQNYPTIVCLVLAIVISALFVAVRLYTRQRATRKLWWDDWTCLIGWIFLVVLASLLLEGLNCGGGSDLWNVSKAKYAVFRKFFGNIEIVGRLGMFFTKASIVLFYRRLFCTSNIGRTPIWWSIWFVFWLNFLYAIAFVLAVALQCAGKAALVAVGKDCVDEYAFVICASVINVTTDIMILIIPIVAVWGLHMAAEKKWRLTAVFAVGTLGVLASVARLAYQVAEANQPNQTIITMILSLMDVAEQFIGIVVSCMPILPAFLRHISKHSQKRYAGSSVKKNFGSSILGYQSGRSKASKAQPKDPYPLDVTRGYEEIDDAEAHMQATGLGGIVRTVEMSVFVDHTPS